MSARKAVRHLVSQPYPAGTHTVLFDATNDRGGRLASGMYFYRFVGSKFVETRKLILLK